MSRLHSLCASLCVLCAGSAAGGIKCVAHRGDYPDAPEHSMAAYRNAVERGSEVLKLDVHPSRDGVIVLSHDPTFKRTMGWDVRIRDVTWDEIRRHTYLLGGQPTQERAVSLPEALEVVKSIPEFWIDFKSFDPDFAERVLATFAQFGIGQDRLMVATYNGDALQYFRKAHPSIRRIVHIDFCEQDGKWSLSFERHLGILCRKAADGEPYSPEVAEHILECARTLDLWGVNLCAVPQVVTPGLVARLHGEGLAVSLALVHDAATARVFANHGGDFVVTRDRRVVAPIICAGQRKELCWQCGPNARIEGNLLVVDVPVGEEKTGGLATAEIDLSAWDGKPVGAEIVASGERIAKPLNWYTGLKFQFEYEDALSGEWSYPNTPSRLGDFPTLTIRVSDLSSGVSRSKARMMIGLQETSGRAVFDLSTLRIGDPAPLWPVTNQTHRCAYTGSLNAEAQRRGETQGDNPAILSTQSSGENASAPLRLCVKKLRGVMSPSRKDPPFMTEADFDTLQSWGVTLIRYQMSSNDVRPEGEDQVAWFDRWLAPKLDHFDSFVLPEAAKRGMKVVLDLHEAPGGRDEANEMRMFHDERIAAHFVETWRRIAERFRGREGIYGYDLVNEPMQTSEAAPGCDFWTLQKRAAEAIREIDPDTPILVECNSQDDPAAFASFSPLDLVNVIYEVHMYKPLAYTHQGVMWKQGELSSYPDETKGWNKDYLRACLKPVRDFQLRHGAKIYVGEFSAVAWAPGADQYLRDCIGLFEEYGWDWTYHAFRESGVWNVEWEGPGRDSLGPAAADTPRKRALLEGLRRE
ncbi:MAG: cellulase family glycosylhydrolase [Kiritimatiellae bacterium]|nr:cellulase family glycosylhydrolase [Kiritimatiellia bacterium]